VVAPHRSGRDPTVVALSWNEGSEHTRANDAIMDEAANKTSGTAATKAVASKRAQSWYLQLWFQALVAMAVGIALGHLRPRLAGIEGANRAATASC
jgi:hypothetical protein